MDDSWQVYNAWHPVYTDDAQNWVWAWPWRRLSVYRKCLTPCEYRTGMEDCLPVFAYRRYLP